MTRFKKHDEGQGLFLSLHLEGQFEEYSLEKTVSKFIENEIDLSVFDKNYKNTQSGQAAYNPKFLLKVILFAYAKGVASSRKIEELLSKHISYIYLSANQRFDHSTICRFILLNAEDIKTLFTKVLCVLNRLDLIKWDVLEIDGTIVNANASKHVSGKNSDFEKLLDRCERYSEKLVERSKYLSEGEFSEDYVKEEDRKIKRQKRLYENTIENIKTYQKKIDDNEFSPNERVNLTDNDSSLLKQRDNKGYVQGYNFHCSFSENDILLDIETLQGRKDFEAIEERIDKLKTLKKELEVETGSSFLMDKGFFSSTVLASLLKEGNDIYIPIPESVKERKLIFKEGHVYLESDGRLLLGSYRKNKNEYRFRYTLANGKRKEITVAASFVEHKSIWEEYRNKMNSEQGKFIYAKRIGKEHNHQTLKEIDGMRRIFRRGRPKVNLEGVLHGIGYNLRKLNKYIKEGELQWAPC